MRSVATDTRTTSTRLNQVLHELEANQLVHPDRGADSNSLFKHALVQETAYQSLLLKRRQELHRRVAAAFQREYAGRIDDHIPTLAYHYWRGEEWPEAAEYARRAGERALQVFASREALAYFMQALQALDHIPDATGEATCDVILGRVQAAFGIEPFPVLLDQLTRAEQIARRLGDKHRLALVLHAIGRVHVAAGHFHRAEPPLAECFALAARLGEDRLSMLPTYAMGMATFDSDPRRALTIFDRAIELARRFEDVDIQAYATGAKTMVQGRLGDAAECRDDIAATLALVDQIKSPMVRSDVNLFLSWAYLDLGDVGDALEYAKRGVQQAVAADNLECACFAYACLGFGHLRAEEMSDAILAFEEAIRRSRISGAEEAQVIGELGLGMVHLYRGQADAVEDLESALAHARRIGSEFGGALLSQALGEIALERGDLELSLELLRAALDYYRRHRMRPYLAGTLELLANALERHGDPREAEQARAEMSELVEDAERET